MARQLPALVSGQRSLSRATTPNSTVARLLATVAPDVIRAAERLATQQLQAREQSRSQVNITEHTEAFHLSELQIDTSVPFVRRITMRNMTAWQNSPVPQFPEPAAGSSGAGIVRKLGLIGVSSVFALGLGLIARRVGPFSGHDASIIDVTPKQKP